MSTNRFPYRPSPLEVAQSVANDKNDHLDTTNNPYRIDINKSADEQIATANIDNPHYEVKIE